MTMIGLSTAAKDDALLALFAGRTFSVGLYSGEEEIKDGRYQRVDVLFSAPQGDDTRFVDNVGDVRFSPLVKAHDVDHWGVFDEAGVLRARYRLNKPRNVPADDNAVFRPGALRIGIP